MCPLRAQLHEKEDKLISKKSSFKRRSCWRNEAPLRWWSAAFGRGSTTRQARSRGWMNTYWGRASKKEGQKQKQDQCSTTIVARTGAPERCLTTYNLLEKPKKKPASIGLVPPPRGPVTHRPTAIDSEQRVEFNTTVSATPSQSDSRLQATGTEKAVQSQLSSISDMAMMIFISPPQSDLFAGEISCALFPRLRAQLQQRPTMKVSCL